MNIYDYKYQSIDGKEVSFEEYENKPLIIVNIASKCGFTPQLEDLQKIYLKYKEQGLEIVGFPCNQFMEQSPEGNSDLQKFCKLNYGVTFKLSEKVDVRGAEAHPLFSYLISQCGFEGFDNNNLNDKMLKSIISEKYPENLVGDAVKWNFTKFLVDKEGNVIRRYEPKVEPMDMVQDIEKLL